MLKKIAHDIAGARDSESHRIMHRIMHSIPGLVFDFFSETRFRCSKPRKVAGVESGLHLIPSSPLNLASCRKKAPCVRP